MLIHFINETLPKTTLVIMTTTKSEESLRFDRNSRLHIDPVQQHADNDFFNDKCCFKFSS